MRDIGLVLVSAAILSLLAVVAPVMAPGAMAQDASLPQQRAEAFLSRIVAGDIGAAYDDIFVGSRFVRSEPQLIAQFKTQTATLPQIWGAMLGFERVSSQTFGSSIVRLVYILKQERHPVVWEFYFYHVKGDWILATLRYMDQLGVLATSVP